MNLRQRLLTQNECYIIGTKIKPCGVMVHSTAANNPWLRRYVGPDDGLLGVNQHGNHWNQFRPGGRQVCAHAFIGKLADGTIAAYQTLPWDVEGWHAGGSGNKMGYIGFEICEDDLTDPVYFSKVYQEAVELTAWLCKNYSLDPLADGVVICHQEGYRRGVASNHADVLHWFPKHGKSMDDFRRDVAENMKEDNMKRYNTMQQLPDWARPTIRKLIGLGCIQGNGAAADGEGYPTDMDLSHDMVRTLVINDRAGAYGG